MVDFVEICNVCVKKVIIEAAKRIINSDKVCHSYSDLNFGVTFFGTQCTSRDATYWRDLNETCHRCSPREWTLLKRFLRSRGQRSKLEVKVRGQGQRSKVKVVTGPVIL